MEKSPEGKPLKENSPELLLVLVRLSRVAWFVRTTEAFGMIAPVESCTVPEIVPLITCAEAGGASFPVNNEVIRYADIAHRKIRFNFELRPCRKISELPGCTCNAPLSCVPRICGGRNACAVLPPKSRRLQGRDKTTRFITSLSNKTNLFCKPHQNRNAIRPTKW